MGHRGERRGRRGRGRAGGRGGGFLTEEERPWVRHGGYDHPLTATSLAPPLYSIGGDFRTTIIQWETYMYIGVSSLVERCVKLPKTMVQYSTQNPFMHQRKLKVQIYRQYM